MRQNLFLKNYEISELANYFGIMLAGAGHRRT